MANIEFVKLLNTILNNVKISNEEIDKILIENSEDKISFTDKITKTLEKYSDDSTTTYSQNHWKTLQKRINKKREKKKRNMEKYNLKKFIRRKFTKEITQ